MSKERDFTIQIIVAMDESGAIGLHGDMPWGRSMKSDLRHFKETTMGHPIIMGRTTYESFPKRPLPGRLNVVLTRDPDYPVTEGAVVATTPEEALRIVEGEGTGTVYIAGGASIYRLFLERSDRLLVTLVHHTFAEADTHFPDIDPEQWVLTASEDHPADPANDYPYSFTVLERKG
jgi:dihydrofolate reductase